MMRPGAEAGEAGGTDMPWWAVVLIAIASAIAGFGICYLGLMWYLARNMWQ